MRTERTKSTDTGSLDLWQVIHLFTHHLGRILVLMLLAFGAGEYYLHHTRAIYESHVLLEVAPDPSAGNRGATLTDDDFSDILNTIELKIDGQAALLRVIRKFHLADDPEFAPPTKAPLLDAQMLRWARFDLSPLFRWIGLGRYAVTQAPDPAPPPPRTTPSEVALIHRLADRIKVRQVRGTRLISVTVDDPDPTHAQRLAQSLINAFYETSLTERARAIANTHELLLAEVNRDSNALRAAEEKLESYRRAHNAVSLSDRQNIVVDRLHQLNEQVAKAQDARLALEPDAAQVRVLLKKDPDELLGIRRVADSPEVVNLRQQLALQEAQVATLAKRYGPLHPTMIQARSQLRALHSALDASVRRAGLRILQSYESAKTTEAALKAALARQEQASMRLAKLAIPYDALQREVHADAAVFQQELAALKQTDVVHSLMTRNDVDGVTVRTIAPPLAPTRPSWPRPKLVLALALVVGLFAGCGSALASHALDNTVTSVDAAESYLDQPVLAIVPRSRHQRMTARPAVIRYPKSPQAEAFRSLRTSLAIRTDQDERPCLLFTSAVPGEGKTFCSLNAAAALAQQGFRTLLIDGDLRRPRLRRILADENENPGLSACLQHPELFPAVVLQTPVANLFCLGDRRSQPGAPELLGGDALGGLLERAQATYERIVIDTAPLLAVSDALCFARCASAICLVIHAGRTPRRYVRRTVRLLDEMARRPLVGVILNLADRRTAAGNYHYYGASSPS